MISAEDVRWKLARCRTCRKRRMMPTGSASCHKCERELRGEVVSAEDARWIVSYWEPEEIVRRAWSLATPSTSAAVGLDMTSGKMTVHRWLAEEECPAEELDGAIVLAVCPAHRRAELPGLLTAGAEGSLSPEGAEELACELIVRSALGDGGERFWRNVDEQLQTLVRGHREEDACT